MTGKVDNFIIGGGTTYIFVEARSDEIGRSLCKEGKIDVAQGIMECAEVKSVRPLSPVDTVATCNFINDTPAETFPAN